jgi:hypothetical protein
VRADSRRGPERQAARPLPSGASRRAVARSPSTSSATTAPRASARARTRRIRPDDLDAERALAGASAGDHAGFICVPATANHLEPARGERGRAPFPLADVRGHEHRARPAARAASSGSSPSTRVAERTGARARASRRSQPASAWT